MSRQDALDNLLRVYEESLQRCESIIESAMSDSAAISTRSEDPHNLVVAVFHILSAPSYDLLLPSPGIHADTLSATLTALRARRDDAGDATGRIPFDILADTFENIQDKRDTADEFASRVVSEYQSANAEETGKKKKVVRSAIDERLIEETNRLCDGVNA